MNVLGFTAEESLSIFKTVAGVLHFGNIEVKQRPREEWATIPTTTEAEKVCVYHAVCMFITINFQLRISHVHILYQLGYYIYMLYA